MNSKINDEVDSLEEYNTILKVLNNAHDTAVKLKDEIADFMIYFIIHMWLINLSIFFN